MLQLVFCAFQSARMYLPSGAMLGGKNRCIMPLKVLPPVQESEITVFQGWEAHLSPPPKKKAQGGVTDEKRRGNLEKKEMCINRGVVKWEQYLNAAKVSKIVWREKEGMTGKRKHGQLSRGLLHGGWNFSLQSSFPPEYMSCLATVGLWKPPSPKCISARRLCGATVGFWKSRSPKRIFAKSLCGDPSPGLVMSSLLVSPAHFEEKKWANVRFK